MSVQAAHQALMDAEDAAGAAAKAWSQAEAAFRRSKSKARLQACVAADEALLEAQAKLDRARRALEAAKSAERQQIAEARAAAQPQQLQLL